MQIRDILKNNPLVLAPMAGITDFPFRRICKELGAGLVFSEMVSVEALIREHKRTHGMLRTDPAERPVVFQIFGSKPASMAEAAHIVSQGDVDFIDINMGCPGAEDPEKRRRLGAPARPRACQRDHVRCCGGLKGSGPGQDPARLGCEEHRGRGPGAGR